MPLSHIVMLGFCFCHIIYTYIVLPLNAMPYGIATRVFLVRATSAQQPAYLGLRGVGRRFVLCEIFRFDWVYFVALCIVYTIGTAVYTHYKLCTQVKRMKRGTLLDFYCSRTARLVGRQFTIQNTDFTHWRMNRISSPFRRMIASLLLYIYDVWRQDKHNATASNQFKFASSVDVCSCCLICDHPQAGDNPLRYPFPLVKHHGTTVAVWFLLGLVASYFGPTFCVRLPRVCCCARPQASCVCDHMTSIAIPFHLSIG